MIRLTLEFTDNLGPEADMAALLRKLDARLRQADAGDAHILVAARLLTDYVADIAHGGWATVILTLRAPGTLGEALAPCAQDLFDLDRPAPDRDLPGPLGGGVLAGRPDRRAADRGPPRQAGRRRLLAGPALWRISPPWPAAASARL